MTGQQFQAIMEGKEVADASTTALLDAHKE
jgi:hypothetical protein